MKSFKLSLFLILSLLIVQTAIPVSAQAQLPVVRALIFWIDGCEHCEDVIQNVLPPLREKYNAQLEVQMIEIIDAQDIKMLHSVAASYNISKERTGVPFLIMGDEVLIGSAEIRENLPSLIDDHLMRGGLDWPKNPILADFLPINSSGALSVTEHPVSAGVTKTRNDGFTIAIVIMVGMAVALLYSIVAFIRGKSFTLADRVDWLIPVLLVIGVAVASYLSYVETQSVPAICGPIGDCNTVQQSRYARLFGILPIGIVGLIGYVALFAAWLIRKFNPKLKKSAALGFFGMAFFAVTFSFYLTYLEPFIIRAVCIWCLTSSVIITLLLLLGISPAVHQFTLSYEDE